VQVALGLAALLPTSFISHLLDLVLFHIVIQRRGMTTYDFLNANGNHMRAATKVQALLSLLTCGLWQCSSNKINPCAALRTREQDVQAGRDRRMRHKQKEAEQMLEPGQARKAASEHIAEATQPGHTVSTSPGDCAVTVELQPVCDAVDDGPSSIIDCKVSPTLSSPTSAEKHDTDEDVSAWAVAGDALEVILNRVH
jgi:hypothetical protein